MQAAIAGGGAQTAGGPKARTAVTQVAQALTLPPQGSLQNAPPLVARPGNLQLAANVLSEAGGELLDPVVQLPGAQPAR
jgi:hypothetical protein